VGDLCSHIGPHAQGLWALGVMLCYHNLEILSDFIFELVFCKWSAMEQWNRYVSRDRPCACPLFLDIPFTQSIHNASWEQDSGATVKHGSSTQLNASTRWACYIFQWASPGAKSPRGPISHANQSLVWAQKEGSGIDKETLSYPFLFILLPCMSQPLT